MLVQVYLRRFSRELGREICEASPKALIACAATPGPAIFANCKAC